MKVVILCDIFDVAIASQENILVKYYRKHGHEVAVIASTVESVFEYIAEKYDPNAPAKLIDYEGARVYRTPYRYNILNRLKPFAGVDRILEKERPDLIFMMDIIPNMREVIAYKRRNPGCRFVMDYHADYTNSGRNWLSLKILHGVIRKRYLDQALPYLDALYPVVPGSAQFLREVYKVPGARLELLPLGADMDVGRAIKARGEGREVRRALGIGQDELVIFTGGKFAPLKRTELLIEAVQRLGVRAPHLIVVGAPNHDFEEYGAGLRAQAAGNPRIHFVGWLGNAELFRHMDASDLAVFPASQSILWVQAVSMGLPLVIGDLGGQDTSYMGLYGNIVTVPREEISTETFARVIAELAEDRSRLQRMRAGAERVFAEVLDWDRLIWKTLGQEPPEMRAPSGAAGRS